MALFQPAAGEKLLFTCGILWNKSKMLAHPGDVHVTDKRVVIEKYATANSGFLAQLIVKFYRAQILFYIPLAEIKKVKYTEKKALLGKNCKLTIEYGDKSVTISPYKPDELLPLLPHVEMVAAE